MLKNKVLIKIWWSLIAPKNRENYLDKIYLKEISDFIRKNILDVFLIHWAGNIWHNFLKKLIVETGFSLKDVLKLYAEKIKYHIQYWYSIIDSYFFDLNRVYIKKVLTGEIKSFSWKITWWDIDWDNFLIISGDDAFSYLASLKNKFDLKLILTDVDWVLDTQGNVIRKIDKNNIKNIKFWSVNNDLTWGMRWKVMKLLWKWPIYILNGYNFKNLELFFKEPDKAIFTQIC